MLKTSLLLLAAFLALATQAAEVVVAPVDDDADDTDIDLVTVGLPEFVDIDQLEAVDNVDASARRPGRGPGQGRGGHRWDNDEDWPGRGQGRGRGRKHRLEVNGTNGGNHRHRHHGRGHGHGHHRHHHFFNATEARQWQRATMEEKVNHICDRLTRHPGLAERTQSAGPGSSWRDVRIEFHRKMRDCCDMESRVECFLQLKTEKLSKLCEEGGLSWTPRGKGRGRAMRNDHLKTECCKLEGEERNECITREFQKWHDTMCNGTMRGPRSPSRDDRVDLFGDDDTERMMGDMAAVDVADDPAADTEDPPRRRRPGRRQGTNQDENRGGTKKKASKRKQIKKRCCKAGREQGTGVDTDSVTVCRNAVQTYMQTVNQGKVICRLAFQKCCLTAANSEDAIIGEEDEDTEEDAQ